ncbi:MAG: hypothetical protein JWM78_2790 [Verrucomicrobiaceae bacterium]|nr:hypothetical protein [Verrucomicrobiaceae bacterium]
MPDDLLMADSAPPNPLLPLVLDALRAAPAGISEYELLKRIEASGAFTQEIAKEAGKEAADANVALFQKHFLLMNALYRLQSVLWADEQLWLHISPLRIALESPVASESAAVALETNSALRDYYLDWQQLLTTDSAAVADLLDGFWRRFHAHDGRADALATLQLDATADWPAIKRQYRRLAAQTHPDRGGDSTQFLAIRAAYELLSAAAGA